MIKFQIKNLGKSIKIHSKLKDYRIAFANEENELLIMNKNYEIRGKMEYGEEVQSICNFGDNFYVFGRGGKVTNFIRNNKDINFLYEETDMVFKMSITFQKKIF